MGLTATDKGGADFEMTPEGQYVARCYKIIDMGTQTSNGQFGTKEQHKVMVSWELLSDPKMEDGRPFGVNQFYTVSLHEKAKLRADLESWRGKKFTATELEGFDLATVIGAYCQIQVVHSEDGKYANVQTIMAYKGDKPVAVNPNVVFDIDQPDMKVFDSLSDNMKTKIQSAPEWGGSTTTARAIRLYQSLISTQNQKELNTSEKAKLSAAVAEKDVIIEDINPEEEINLDDIPF